MQQAKALLKEAVAELEPETLEGATAARLVELLSEVERVAAAGKALTARRVVDSGAWRSSGERSPAHWMASTTKTSVGSAAGVLETAANLTELPATDRAVRSGRLSQEQAKEIASAAAASPASERELLGAAERESLADLRKRCAQVRAAALPDESERHNRIRARRRLRHWREADGAFRLAALLTPDAGARVLAALEPVTERIFGEAKGRDGASPTRPTPRTPSLRSVTTPAAARSRLSAMDRPPSCTCSSATTRSSVERWRRVRPVRSAAWGPCPRPRPGRSPPTPSSPPW